MKNITKWVAALGALFFLAALPLLFFQPSGPAGAGLSGGFLRPLENPLHALAFLAVGVAAGKLGREGVMMLPLAFLMMLVIGFCSDIGASHLPSARILLFSAVLFFALTVGAASTRLFVTVATLASGLAFYFGARYATRLPEIVSVEFYLLGIIICVMLLLATGVSLYLSLKGQIRRLRERARKLPAVTLSPLF